MKFFLPVLVSLLGAALGVFFVYKGLEKHFLQPLTGISLHSNVPADYKLLITVLSHAGFIKITGIIIIMAGLLLLVPKTRLLGTIVILPIIILIFLFHLLIDNRPTELLESGVPLMLLISIIMFHKKDWRGIIAR